MRCGCAVGLSTYRPAPPTMSPTTHSSGPPGMLVTHMSFLLQCRRNALSAAPFCCPGTSDATAERQSPAALRTASAVVSRPEFHTFRCGGMPSRTIPRPTLHGTAASETSHNEPSRSHAAARGENGTALAPQRQCQSVPFTAGSLTLILPSLSRKIIAASSWRFVSPATRSRSSNDFERLVVGGRCPKRFGLVRSACRAHAGTARHGPQWSSWPRGARHPPALAPDRARRGMHGRQGSARFVPGRHQYANCFPSIEQVSKNHSRRRSLMTTARLVPAVVCRL
jgi:hypothetical protein